MSGTLQHAQAQFPQQAPACVQDACERGWFQTAISRPGMTAPPLAVLVATATEIAAGMQYLHEREPYDACSQLHSAFCLGSVVCSRDMHENLMHCSSQALSRASHTQVTFCMAT